MYKSTVLLSIIVCILSLKMMSGESSMATNGNSYVSQNQNTLAERSFSLENRYEVKRVNDVFKDNILLTLSYLKGDVKSKADIDWGKVEEPKLFEFSLKPGDSFTFHDQILPDYKNNVVKMTDAHFNYQDGFKSDGYLIGDGVCHLASLMYWVAKEAGLEANAPTNHNFAKINEVPKEYGVSIYSLPGSSGVGSKQNLYIKNNLDKTIAFVFNYDGTNLAIKVDKENI